MRSLTIIFITARREPMFQEFVDSIAQQTVTCEDLRVICVDLYAEERDKSWLPGGVTIVPPKPSVWYGPHRLTKQQWWGVASFRNAGLCLAQTEWVSVADDRSVLGPQWLESVADAMNGEYAVAGSYEKTHNMVVEFGRIKSYEEPRGGNGNFTGKDPREQRILSPRIAPGQWFLGCTSALPLEWALNVNGWDETCDSLGLEDCIFGQMLERNGYPIMYDERMKLWEDRTSGKCSVETVRTDKGKSPHDRSHMLLDITKGKKRATHDVDLRDIRARLARGEPWPIPTTPTHDYYDGQPLSEMFVK